MFKTPSTQALEQGQLEVDPQGSDSEDAYYSGTETETTSLMTAARMHTFENGRRYHGYKEGKYELPNDEQEQDRMDIMHHCCLLALHGELILAPVGKDWNPQKILDVGTGSGIWAIDMADAYPSAHVIGTDLSPIQPQWVPPNVSFEVDDLEEIWTYKENSFDYIHLRNMAGYVYDWDKLYEQAYKALKPGGWIEVQDFSDIFSCDDGSLPKDAAIVVWLEHWAEAVKKLGREWNNVAPEVAGKLRQLGCVTVDQKLIRLPFGRWTKDPHQKEVGAYWRLQTIQGAEAITMALFTRVLGWSKERVDEFVIKVDKDLKNSSFHTYSKFYCTYGRKPF
ncbi:hypothetical protein RUND412_007443 [Rhizina undulata]